MNNEHDNEDARRAVGYDDVMDCLGEALGIIGWMSGSADFAPGGKAHEGWVERQETLRLLESSLRASRTMQTGAWLLDREVRAADVCGQLQHRIDEAMVAWRKVNGDDGNVVGVELVVSHYVTTILVDDAVVWDTESGYAEDVEAPDDEAAPNAERCWAAWQRRCARLSACAPPLMYVTMNEDGTSRAEIVPTMRPSELAANIWPGIALTDAQRKALDDPERAMCVGVPRIRAVYDAIKAMGGGVFSHIGVGVPEDHTEFERSFDALCKQLGVPARVFSGDVEQTTGVELARALDERDDARREAVRKAVAPRVDTLRTLFVADEASGMPDDAMKYTGTWAKRVVNIGLPPVHRDFSVTAAALDQARADRPLVIGVDEANLRGALERLNTRAGFAVFRWNGTLYRWDDESLGTVVLALWKELLASPSVQKPAEVNEPATLPKSEWIGEWPLSVKAVDEVAINHDARSVLNMLVERGEQEDYDLARMFVDSGVGLSDALKEELRGAMYDWRNKRGIA